MAGSGSLASLVGWLLRNDGKVGRRRERLEELADHVGVPFIETAVFVKSRDEFLMVAGCRLADGDLAREGGALAQGISQLAALLWPLPVVARKSVLGRLFPGRPNSPPQLKPGH